MGNQQRLSEAQEKSQTSTLETFRERGYDSGAGHDLDKEELRGFFVGIQRKCEVLKEFAKQDLFKLVHIQLLAEMQPPVSSETGDVAATRPPTPATDRPKLRLKRLPK